MTQRHEDSDDDTYVTIGAAFERLETDEDVQKEKHKKEKEQYVTDSKGRRRFHGAFTGGFSAGYFNTVGSEEGWTPSSFVSSRDKKSSFSHQKPEDFMDEEDLGAYGIAPRAITAKEEYDQQKPGSKRSAESAQPGVIPGVHPLQNLIVPTKSSVGARLLKAMGWREGEGVGPKKMKYVPPQKASGKEEIYSRDHSETADDTENMPPPGRHFKAAEGFMFAPKDVTPWQFEAKDDMHGIGYRGIQDMGVLSTQQSTKSLYGMSGAAFGIGALEEEEEVDNVYAVESMISYDNTLAGEGDISTERKYGWTGGHESDWGLSSFSIASNQTNKAKRYPPPQVPRDFVPVHNFGNTAAASSVGTAGKRHHKPLTSAVRTQMLSDAPGSVFSLLSAADRDRLKRVTVQAREKGTSDSYIPPATLESKQAKSSSVLSPKGNQAKNLSAERLKPFVRDPDKQARYEAFLAGKQPEKPSSEYGMTEWERQKEREEFSKTARIFQPLSSTLASRFRRSEDAVKDKKEMESEPMSPESDAIQAAKANMFGVLTREIEEWHPHRILCKRFNVPDPYPGSGVVGVSKGNEVRYSNTIASSATKRSIDFLHTERLIPVEQPNEQETELTEESPANLTSEDQNVELQSSTTIPTNTDDVGEDTKRPPMDLFKSIFAESSSESEASGSESDMETDHKQPRHTASSHSSATTHIDQQKSRWQDLSVVTTKLPAITTTVSKQSDSSHKSDFPKPVHNAPVFMSTQHHIPSTLDKHSLDAHSTQQRSEIQQSPSKVEVVIRKEERISQIQDYGPPLPPDFGAAEDLSKHGNSSTRRQSDSSKHKRKHSKKSHRKEGTSEHHKKRKHSRHK